jgi:hypothetical protein
MRGFLAVACFIVVVLAGCISGQTKEAAPTKGSADPKGPLVAPDSDYGAVRGNVTTEEMLPVPEAEVGLVNTDHKTTTDAVGQFAMTNIVPGKYVLVIQKLGYQSTARNVVVTAGHVSETAFILASMEAPSVAYVVVYPFTGYMDCAVQVPVWVSACSYPYTAAWGSLNNTHVNPGLPKDVQNNVNRFNISIKQTVGQLYAELEWKAASAAATRMQMIILCGDYDYVWDDCLWPDSAGSSIRFNDSNGKSPVRVGVMHDVFASKGKDKGKYDINKNPSIWIMNYIALPFGCIPRTSGYPSATDCAAGLPGNEVQIAFQQKYQVWDSVFYNGVAPEGYTLVQDI